MSGALPTGTDPAVIRRNFMLLQKNQTDVSADLSALEIRMTTAETDITALENYRVYSPPAAVLDIDNGTLVWDAAGTQVMTEGYP